VRYAVTDKTIDGFTISLLDDAPVGLTFDWIALASDDPETDDPESEVSNDPNSGDTVVDVDAPADDGDGSSSGPEISNDPDSGTTVIDVETPLVSEDSETEDVEAVEEDVVEAPAPNDAPESVDSPDVEPSEPEVSTEEGV
jgi:hypothetical protein